MILGTGIGSHTSNKEENEWERQYELSLSLSLWFPYRFQHSAAIDFLSDRVVVVDLVHSPRTVARYHLCNRTLLHAASTGRRLPLLPSLSRLFIEERQSHSYRFAPAALECRAPAAESCVFEIRSRVLLFLFFPCHVTQPGHYIAGRTKALLVCIGAKGEGKDKGGANGWFSGRKGVRQKRERERDGEDGERHFRQEGEKSSFFLANISNVAIETVITMMVILLSLLDDS